MLIDTEIKVNDLIEEAEKAERTGDREHALGALEEARLLCIVSPGGQYREGLAKVYFAKGSFYRNEPGSELLAINCYEEAIRFFTSTVFTYDHFNERPGMIEEALWQIFVLNVRLRQFREAATAANRALSGVRFPVVPGKPFAHTSVMSLPRMLALTAFAVFDSTK